MSSGSTPAGEAGHGTLASAVTSWQPARLLSKAAAEEPNYALLFLNQPLESLDLLKLVWERAGYRIAADGGGNRIYEAFKDHRLAGLIERIGLEIICGDLDSLEPHARDWATDNGTSIIEDPDQYSTDFTKCVKYIRDHYAPNSNSPPDILCMGGIGGRVDQGMSVLHHLYMFQKDPNYSEGRVYLLSTEAITFVLKAGKHRIQVRDPSLSVFDKHVGIIPLREPSIISTNGLEWDVQNWYTEFGGQMSTSNHVKDDFVDITTTKDVLFTIDLKSPIGDPENMKEKA